MSSSESPNPNPFAAAAGKSDADSLGGPDQSGVLHSENLSSSGPGESTPPFSESFELSPSVPLTGVAEGSSGSQVAEPRWWTTLAVLFLSGISFLLASAVMTIVAFVLVHGELDIRQIGRPEAMREVLQSRVGLFTLVVFPQLMLLVPPVVAAALSPEGIGRRLGLVRGHWPVWTWFAAAAATPLVGLVSSVVVGSFLQESHSLKMMSEVFREHGNNGFLIPLALIIGATPALCEELLFRGYVQTRLTRSAGPVIGILSASVLFAAFHMDAVHVIAVFPLGLFLGWISWRSGSLFPAMIGHFVNNVISVIAVAFAAEGAADVLALPAMMVSLSILGLGMIGMSVVVVASVVYGSPDKQTS